MYAVLHVVFETLHCEERSTCPEGPFAVRLFPDNITEHYRQVKRVDYTPMAFGNFLAI